MSRFKVGCFVLLGLGVLVESPLPAQTCSLNMNCSACANSGDFPCSCPSNVPGANVRSCAGVSQPRVDVAEIRRARIATVAFAQSEGLSGVVDIPAVGAEDPSSPLRVTSAQLEATGRDIVGVRYTVTNAGAKAAVAYMVQLRLRDREDRDITILFRVDGFFGRGDLAPGQAQVFHPAFRQEMKAPLKSAALVVTFALLEGGEAVGRNAAAIASDLEASYRKQLGVYQQVTQALANAPADKQVQAAEAALRSAAPQPHCSDAVADLLHALNSRGIEGLRKALASQRPLW